MFLACMLLWHTRWDCGGYCGVGWCVALSLACGCSAAVGRACEVRSRHKLPHTCTTSDLSNPNVLPQQCMGLLVPFYHDKITHSWVVLAGASTCTDVQALALACKNLQQQSSKGPTCMHGTMAIALRTWSMKKIHPDRSPSADCGVRAALYCGSTFTRPPREALLVCHSSDNVNSPLESAGMAPASEGGQDSASASSFGGSSAAALAEAELAQDDLDLRLALNGCLFTGLQGLRGVIWPGVAAAASRSLFAACATTAYGLQYHQFRIIACTRLHACKLPVQMGWRGKNFPM